MRLKEQPEVTVNIPVIVDPLEKANDWKTNHETQKKICLKIQTTK